jgi:predicted AAA+ superfamily ATPase
MHYKEYMSHGGFPLHIIEKNTLFRTIKKMIYEDALAEFNLSEKKVDIAERLLGFLSVSKPGEFSFTSFSNVSGYAKSTVIEATVLLTELEILRSVEEKSPQSKAKKSVKLMFSHPNLRSAVAEQMMKKPETGWLREEYFVFHMNELAFGIFVPKKMKKNPDYEIEVNGKTLLFEIGGESKTKKQLMGREGSVIDDEKLIVLGFVQKTDQK